jgi:nicotinate-nucleotide adenylyltransferase
VSRRIGILGGTFDPIHRGHIDLGAAAKSALQLERLFVIPANVPPHRAQPCASAFHRFAMVALTVSSRTGWRASDLELRTAALSFTSTTLHRFHERGYVPSEMFFVIGADAFVDVGSWKDYPDILDAAHFAVVSRPGCTVHDLPQRLPTLASRMIQLPADDLPRPHTLIFLIDAVTADVSSTTIRRLRADNQPITGMVDLGVQQHIEQHGLYTSRLPGRRGNDGPTALAAGRLHGQSES